MMQKRDYCEGIYHYYCYVLEVIVRLPLAAACFLPRIPRRKMVKKSTIILKNFENDTICILVLIFNWIDSLTDKEEWHSGALTP